MRIKIFHDTRSHMIWVVRIVEKGEKYGLKNKLTHDGDLPLVEFYDPRYEHTHLGQFVSRYNIATLLERETQGLLLDTGSPDWTVGEACMNRVRDWLRRQA